MKLNPDCIRDILLFLEESIRYTENSIAIKHNKISFERIIQELSSTNNYNPEDITYSIEKLIEGEYVKLYKKVSDKDGDIVNAYINDITWKGHEFLNNVRSKNIWSATKKGASKLGTMSIDMLSFIATRIITALVTRPDVLDSMIQNFK